MQTGIRIRLLLRNSSEELKLLETKAKDYENQEQSTRLINEMIINVRTLLYRTKLIKQEIQHTNDQQGIGAVQLKMEEYKKFQKSLQRPFFSASQLDQSMTGAFVMRLCRQMSYWASFLYFIVLLVEQIDDLFNEQKKKSQLNIELIYFLAIKKINNKTDQMLKNTLQKVLASLASVSSDQENRKIENQIFLDPISQLAIQREKNMAKMKEMEQFMNKMISKVYRGLQIVSLEPIRVYKTEMTQEFNLNAVLKKQLKRNKRFKIQIQQFAEQYSHYKKKRMNKINSYTRLQEKNSKIARTNSTIIKGSLQSLVSLKDLFGKSKEKKSKLKFPILAPSRFENQKSNPVSIAISRSRSQKRNQLSGSKQKSKMTKCQKKENVLLPKSNKLKL